MRRSHSATNPTGHPGEDPLESPKKKSRSKPKRKSKPKPKSWQSLPPERQRQLEERATLVEFRCKNDADGALAWYKRMVSTSVPLDQNMFALLLSVVADNITEVSLEATLGIYEDMKTRGFCNEATESLLVRAFCNRDDPGRAEDVVKDMESRGEEPRIRTVLPLLECYSRLVSRDADLEMLGNVARVYAAVKRAVLAKDEDFEGDTFCMVLRGLAGCRKKGDVQVKVEAENLGSRCIADIGNYVRFGDEGLTRCIKEWLETLAEKWVGQQGCVVDEQGKCQACGLMLHARELAKEQEWELATATEKLVVNAGGKASGPWNAFKRWLKERRDQGEYDCVVDVANVAYYESNGVNAKLRFDFSAVKRVVNLLEEQGRKCVLVMHESHLGKRDCRTPEDRALVQEWRAKGALFTVPRGLLDDWFWLYATLVQGDRTLIVSNDWMRDHHFMMLNQKDFQRWREQHQVRFEMVQVEGAQQPSRPLLHFPTVFTARVQVEYVEDGTLTSSGNHRIKRGPYVPNGALKSIHVPISTREIRKTKKGQPLPYVSDIPQPDELSWYCFRKAA